MFKSIARVVFVVLISLGIIAAASPNVQARLGSILRKAESASISADAQSVEQTGANGRSRYFQSENFYQDSPHDCNSKDPSSDY